MSIFKLTKEAEELGYLNSIYNSNKENESNDVSYGKVIETSLEPMKYSIIDIGVGSGIGMGVGTLIGSKIKALGPGKGAYIGGSIGAIPGLSKEKYLYMKKITNDIEKENKEK